MGFKFPPGHTQHLLVAAMTCDHRLVSAGLVAVIVTFLALIIVGLAAVRTVPPQQTYVVELFGRYRRTLEPGVHLLLPLVESVHAKVNMGEQVAAFPPRLGHQGDSGGDQGNRDRLAARLSLPREDPGPLPAGGALRWQSGAAGWTGTTMTRPVDAASSAKRE